MKVAIPTPWPSGSDGELALPVHIGSFKIRFPGVPESLLVLRGGDVIARYGKERWIGASLRHASGSGLPERDGPQTPTQARDGQLGFADIPRIMLTTTPFEVEPANHDDLRIWRSALTGKHDALLDTAAITMSTRGPLTLYLLDGGAPTGNGVAQLTHERVRDSYLYVSARGFTFDEFRRVAATIQPTRE